MLKRVLHIQQGVNFSKLHKIALKYKGGSINQKYSEEGQIFNNTQKKQ